MTRITLKEPTPAQRATAAAAVVAVSAAQARLDRLKKQNAPVLLPFECDGEIFYIRHLNIHGLISVADALMRDAKGILQLAPSRQSGAGAVTAVVLEHCVCNEDGTPYFSGTQVEDYMDSPDLASLVSSLFLQCNVVNPDILNTLKKT